jgi:hypothetical protein
MRKLFIPFLALIAMNALGQNAPRKPMPPPPPVFVVALQMGTDTVKNDIDTVKLTRITISEMKEAAADSNYTVMLTPRGNCGQLNLMKTKSHYFIVKQQSGLSPKAIFDYIVYSRQSRPWMPPMPNQQ